jgi:peptide deformylase
MLRPIVQAGDPGLRRRARDLTPSEIVSPAIQLLIDDMRETMRDAPGVGLAAPQVGEPLRMAVIEDPSSTVAALTAGSRAALEREAVPFHVIINPVITVLDAEPRSFFEGCLSLTGFRAVTPRARSVRVEALDERARPVTITATGWYARILQHEIDHLDGSFYIDRMLVRTFMSNEQFARHWSSSSVDELCAALGAR